MTQTQAQALRFTTRPYYLSHMKEPRGCGCWAFRLLTAEDREPMFFYGTLAAAKKLAVAHYAPIVGQRVGALIEVLP